MRAPAWFTLFLIAALHQASAAGEIVVTSYNLENYLGAEQAGPPSRQAHPKSEVAISAEVQIIKGIAPDILGVCEMGRPEQFADFQHRLVEAGLKYTDSEYVQAADPDRHLALVSRFPIVSRQSQANVTYELNGVPYKVLRGFLDVTVRINGQFDLRLIGVHLKSKLAVREGEAVIRRHEAALLRQYVEKILVATPDVNLLLYGDFNDTRNESSITEITGPRTGPTHMAELTAQDSAGERWTQYWEPADLYSRIDYFFASPALVHQILPGHTKIDSSPHWHEASDHRAIITSIIPANRAR